MKTIVQVNILQFAKREAYYEFIFYNFSVMLMEKLETSNPPLPRSFK